ncbi:MAG: hypothetical protein ABS949_14755 [Solibacillus sp.]
MAIKTITGNGGNILATDYRNLTWTGKTKGGNACKITLENAINKGNLEWTLAEKGEAVAAIEFEACYSNTDTQATEEDTCPWKIEIEGDVKAGASEILLGLGVFAIDGKDVALCRGGGTFKIEREFRDIVADGDKGSVKDRIALDAERAKLSMNALTMLASLDSLYPALNVAEGATTE